MSVKRKGFIKPELNDALLFLTTEVGELVDACIRVFINTKYARNNEKPTTKEDVLSEIEDCRMMLDIIEDRVNEDNNTG